MLKGLQYVGSANGITIQLYKKYKTVTVSWDKPYVFTAKDIVNEEAEKFYRKNYGPLGIKLVIEPDADKDIDPIKDNTKVVSEGIVEDITPIAEGITTEVESVDDEVQEDTFTATENEVVENADVDTADEYVESTSSDNNSIESICKSIVSEYSVEAIQDASVGDLGEILDARFDTDQIKTIAKAVGYEYGKTRSKSKIISYMLDEFLAEVISYILSF